MQSIAEKETQLDFIDGLRGFAILMVMMNHWFHFFLMEPDGVSRFAATERWLTTGNLGVVLFFLVSSFTLFLSSNRRFQTERSPFRNFYLRRAFRILPLWWVAVMVFVGLNQLPWHSHLKCCFTMLFGFTLGHNHPVIGSWSLFVEESFYLLFPLVISQLTSLRRAFLFLLVAYGVRLAWLRLAPQAHWITSNVIFPFFPLAHWYAFGLGICLYFLYQRQEIRQSVLQSRSWGHALALMAGLVCFRVLGRDDWGGGDDLSGVALCLVFLAAFHPHNIFGWLARRRVVRSFGVCCYSLYLFHGAFIVMAKPWLKQTAAYATFKTYPLEIKFLISFPLFALLSLALCYVSYRLFERPLVRLGKRVIETLERPPLTEPAAA